MYGNGVATAPIAVRECGPITAAMESRDKIQAALRESVANLEMRLGPILSSDVPAQPQEGNTKLDRPQRHAEQLNTANGDLEQIVGWIQQITNRIEL